MKNFWLVKQEPSSYSWSDFVAEGQTSWTGVRNYTARNNLRRMEKGDEALFYHSGEDKAVVGIAKVVRTAYRDSTAKEGDWSTVDLAPVKPLGRPVTLREIKSHSRLKGTPLVRQSRLSVMPLAESEFREIVKMGGIMDRLLLKMPVRLGPIANSRPVLRNFRHQIRAWIGNA